MPDLADLTLEQQMALRSAAHNLHREFEGIFGTETIELFLATRYEKFASQARIPTCRHGDRSGPSHPRPDRPPSSRPAG